MLTLTAEYTPIQLTTSKDAMLEYIVQVINRRRILMDVLITLATLLVIRRMIVVVTLVVTAPMILIKYTVTISYISDIIESEPGFWAFRV